MARLPQDYRKAMAELDTTLIREGTKNHIEDMLAMVPKGCKLA